MVRQRESAKRRAAGCADCHPIQQAWIFSRGSLTRRLQRCCQHPLEVRVRAQRVTTLPESERRQLQVPYGRRCLIREVDLVCAGVVWVQARTLIPVTSLQGTARRLKLLRNRPLGALLFSVPEVTQGATRPWRNLLNSDGQAKHGWVRVTPYGWNQRPLLVMEYFTPEFWGQVLSRDLPESSA